MSGNFNQRKYNTEPCCGPAPVAPTCADCDPALAPVCPDCQTTDSQCLPKCLLLTLTWPILSHGTFLLSYAGPCLWSFTGESGWTYTAEFAKVDGTGFYTVHIFDGTTSWTATSSATDCLAFGATVGINGGSMDNDGATLVAGSLQGCCSEMVINDPWNCCMVANVGYAATTVFPPPVRFAPTTSCWTAPLTWSMTGPAGWSIDSNGYLTGTTAVLGSQTITVTVTDAHGCTGTRVYTINILCDSYQFASETEQTWEILDSHGVSVKQGNFGVLNYGV